MPMARRRDPETSHEAAKRAASFADGHRTRILAALEGALTIKELAQRTGLDHVAIARRMPELQRMGLAQPTDTRRAGCRAWKRT